MDKSGQIDQLISGVIVVVIAVFMSLIFVLVSGGVGKFVGSSEEGSSIVVQKDADSRLLAEFFLSDKINGNLVRDDLLSIVDRINKERQIPIDELTSAILPIEKLFSDRYACSANEVYFIVRPLTAGLGSKPSLQLILEYPAKKWSSGGQGLPRIIQEGSSVERDLMLYGLFDIQGHSGEYYNYLIGPNSRVIVREVKSC